MVQNHPDEGLALISYWQSILPNGELKMKILVLGLIVLVSLVTLLGCGDMPECHRSNCEQIARVGSKYCAYCSFEFRFDIQLASADAIRAKKEIERKRARFERIWNLYDQKLAEVRSLADAINPPTEEVLQKRRKIDLMLEFWRISFLHRRGLLDK